MTDREITIPEIVSMLAALTEQLCADLLPNGRRSGPEWLASGR